VGGRVGYRAPDCNEHHMTVFCPLMQHAIVRHVPTHRYFSKSEVSAAVITA